ncbi:asparagine synthase (glutamine-hydrolyzing) [Nitrospira moscoviensis]|uniref:asparagine synthase (glutamine-hydrolyzing) n=1 Tax=Nitrospira moscoviensis TaxID=42253 RepID=A0A0K2GEL6_NITMO|nr:asparagine synthase (glutamine-hydrolyzing) [Nitrospira moscoviensis]ALA59047.1 Asparagine synthase (Glutamine-hydrolyzing) [Nitrospira moscoviensis]
MCAIAGIIHLDARARVDEARLRRMNDVQRHRGPDGAGVWADGRIGLAHRRLAIVDVAGGHQPMANEDGSVWIVFNGEIYNHAALRPDLIRLGHRYRTQSDTETIVHLYEELGARCVERLQGMFAFALWDSRRGTLLLARDRLGIKPLYYARTDHELLFASEIKGLLAGGLRAEFNEAILPEFLAHRYVAGEETFYRGIRKVLPARTLEWSAAAGFRERRYWQPPTETLAEPARSREEQAEALREEIRGAVRSHLMSDVPLGVFLSGGLDSSGLAALMAPLVTPPLQSFSVGFTEREANELPYARQVAEAVGAEHHEILVSPEQFMQALPRLIWHEDEPIAFHSSVPLYFVSRLAQRHVKVVLTGEGADELYLGYDYRYRVTVLNDRIGRWYWRGVPAPIRRRAAASLGALPPRLERYASRSFLAYDPGPRGIFFDNFSVFPDALQRDLIVDKGVLTARDPHADGLCYWQEHRGDLRERMSYVDMHTHLVELLMKQDQMSMAASLESRVPYLDHVVVEQGMRMPGAMRLRGWRTKAVLRDALRPLLPERILTRPKMGFPVPFGRWLRGPYRSAVEDYVLSPRALDRNLFQPAVVRRIAEEHRTGVRSHADRLWLLINLELWQRMAIDGEAPAEIQA